jgi:hypothetical protein
MGTLEAVLSASPVQTPFWSTCSQLRSSLTRVTAVRLNPQEGACSIVKEHSQISAWFWSWAHLQRKDFAKPSIMQSNRCTEFIPASFVILMIMKKAIGPLLSTQYYWPLPSVLYVLEPMLSPFYRRGNWSTESNDWGRARTQNQCSKLLHCVAVWCMCIPGGYLWLFVIYNMWIILMLLIKTYYLLKNVFLFVCEDKTLPND